VVAHLNEHFKSTGYKEPSNPAKGPYQKLHNTDTSFYEHIANKPDHSENFTLAMTANSGASFDLSKYPFPEKLARVGADEIAPIDCGGGRGQVLRELNTIFPSWGAKMMLQDRPEVLESLKDEKKRGFEIMAHSFYDEQVVRGNIPSDRRERSAGARRESAGERLRYDYDVSFVVEDAGEGF
jgi:hypothetical protein